MHSHDTPKQCKKCGSTDFNNGGDCRPCKSAYNRAYRLAHLDEITQRQSRHRQLHRDRILEQRRHSHQINKDERNRKCREYYRQNRTKIIEHHKQSRRQDSEAYRAKEREYWASNRSHILSRRRRRYLERKDWYNQYVLQRRAVRRGVNAEYVDPKIVRERDNNICYLCGERITKNLELDHVIPICQGGGHTLDNVRATHRACNRAKNGRRPEQVLHLFPWLSANPEHWDTPPFDAHGDEVPHTDTLDSCTN